MSVTASKYPSRVSFAGNPILLKVSTNLSGQTFLKVCAEVTVSVYQQGTPLASYARTLSIPTVGGGQQVVFNLSDVIASGLSQIVIERNQVLAPSGGVSLRGGYARYSLKVWDEYLDQYNEVVSTQNSTSVVLESRIAIPGAFSDMQRLSLPEDTDSYLGSQRVLSSKPAFEAIPAGGRIVTPVFSDSQQSVGVYLNRVSSDSLIATKVLYASETSWDSVSLPADVPTGVHSLVFQNSMMPSVPFYVVPQRPFQTYFEFVNRLGGVESVYTFGRGQHKASFKQERQVLKHDVSFRPSARYIKRTLQNENTILMSTGPVSREWARWFVSEFFTSTQVWMYDAVSLDMLPVIIETDEAVTLYNESQAEVLDLPFTVVKCMND